MPDRVTNWLLIDPVLRVDHARRHCALRFHATRVSRYRSLAITGLCLLLGGQASVATPTSAFNLTEPAPGVFVHIGKQVALDAPAHDDIANIGFITGKRCVAVIDSGGSVRIGNALHAAIRARTTVPICYVINTHVHVDHVLGNYAFVSDKPIFVGSQNLRAAIARSRDFFMKTYPEDFEQPADAKQVIGPDKLVKDKLELDLGGRKLELKAWPKAHTDCDLTVYDERTATLWTGDLLFRKRLPALDGSILGWLRVIDELAAMKNVKLAVPGHGPITHDLALALKPERHYLKIVVDGVRREIRQGKTMQDAMSQVGNAQRSHWLVWQGVHQRNVARAYEELEWE